MSKNEKIAGSVAHMMMVWAAVFPNEPLPTYEGEEYGSAWFLMSVDGGVYRRTLTGIWGELTRELSNITEREKLAANTRCQKEAKSL
jgi:hypothetical protein